MGGRTRRFIHAVGAILFGSICGCTTHLNATRVLPDGPLPTTGAPYFLTFTRFEITATRRVGACEKKEPDGSTRAAIVIETQLDVKRIEDRDPLRHYVVDLESLQSRLKSTDVTIGYYDSGALKSVNASADDRTGEVISSVVTTIGKAVVGTAGVGAAAENTVCSDDTAASVASVADNRKRTEALTRELETDVATLQHLTALAATLGKAIQDSERRRLAAAMDSVEEKRKQIVALAEELKTQLKKISIVAIRKWPANGDELNSAEALFAALTKEQLRKWGALDEDSEEFRQLLASTAIWARIEPTTALTRAACVPGSANATHACAGDMDVGLKYRIPVPGRLVLCSSATCIEDGKDKQDEVHLSQIELISQLGPIFVLPLKSTAFSNKSIQAAFAENGMPQTLGVKSSASAEKAATTFGTVADQFLKARESVVTNKLERVKAETELLKAEAELATARKALEPPKADPYEEQKKATEAFQADTALLGAELANIKARAALEAASASSDGS